MAARIELRSMMSLAAACEAPHRAISVNPGRDPLRGRPERASRAPHLQAYIQSHTAIGLADYILEEAECKKIPASAEMNAYGHIMMETRREAIDLVDLILTGRK